MTGPGSADKRGVGVLVAAGGVVGVLLVTALLGLGMRESGRATPHQTQTPSGASPSGSAGTGLRIPDDFPLLAGYPDRPAESADLGRQGPNRTLAPIVLEACGRRVESIAHTDLVRAAWTNVEDFRQRQLTTYADEAAAQAYVKAILGVYRDCPRQDTDDGYSSVSSVLPHRLGDSGAVAATRYERDGYPAIGLTLVQVVRVGPTVLVAATSNEGGGGPADAERQLRDAAAAGGTEIEDVVATMCALAMTDC